VPAIINPLISIIMWHHRRHAAARTTNEVHDLTSPMHQASVEHWLEEQNTPRDTEQYSHETWYVVNLFDFLTTYPMCMDPTHVGGIGSWLSAQMM
jgi:hypothetical protein